MAVGTYISVLVRAHLRELSPLPKPELMALKQSVAETGAIGRNLNQLTRLAHQGGGGPTRGDLLAILKACEALRVHTKELVKANARSWRTGDEAVRRSRDEPLFDLTSYGRAGSGRRMYLTPAQIALIHRTVTRTPEVMIKATGGAGSSTGRGVVAHFNYIGQGGDLEIETDDGERVFGKDAGRRLIRDWDLDMDEKGQRTELFAFNRRKPPRLVHKIIFSMPAGTTGAHVIDERSGFKKYSVHIANWVLLKEQELRLLAPLPLRDVLKTVDRPGEPRPCAQENRRARGRLSGGPGCHRHTARTYHQDQTGLA
jgi:hypothetical protein